MFYDAEKILLKGDTYVVLRNICDLNQNTTIKDYFYGFLCKQDGSLAYNFGPYKSLPPYHSGIMIPVFKKSELMSRYQEKIAQGYKVFEIHGKLSSSQNSRPEGLENATFLMPKDKNKMTWGVYDNTAQLMFFVPADIAKDLSLDFGLLIKGLNKF